MLRLLTGRSRLLWAGAQAGPGAGQIMTACAVLHASRMAADNGALAAQEPADNGALAAQDPADNGALAAQDPADKGALAAQDPAEHGSAVWLVESENQVRA